MTVASQPVQKFTVRRIPEKEIKAVQEVIVQLQRYEANVWGIGLDGTTSEPDEFLAFFTLRHLPFRFFVVNASVSVGDYEAYSENIATLNQYIQDLCQQEITASQNQVTKLLEYKSRSAPVGLTPDTFQPDEFFLFFSERELPFKPYVRQIDCGHSSAYDENIHTLKSHITFLQRYV